MEYLIGKLNCAVHIIPLSRYFLTRLCHLLKRGKKWGPQRLQSWHRQDPHLWIKIIQWFTTRGVSINNIVFTTPTVALWSNACKYRIKGYNNKGTAWRWYISPEWHGILTLNLLEFLYLETSIHMTIQQVGKGYHILVVSSSAL